MKSRVFFLKKKKTLITRETMLYKDDLKRLKPCAKHD